MSSQRELAELHLPLAPQSSLPHMIKPSHIIPSHVAVSICFAVAPLFGLGVLSPQTIGSLQPSSWKLGSKCSMSHSKLWPIVTPTAAQFAGVGGSGGKVAAKPLLRAGKFENRLPRRHHTRRPSRSAAWMDNQTRLWR
jgi:hypothetical protein